MYTLYMYSSLPFLDCLEEDLLGIDSGYGSIFSAETPTRACSR